MSITSRSHYPWTRFPDAVNDPKASGRGKFAALAGALDLGAQSCGIHVIGDSTGNDTTDWAYLFAQAVAVEFPEWTVHHRLWSDGSQDYGSPTVIQTGTAGALTATNTTKSLINDGDGAAVTGDLDVRVKVTPTVGWASGVADRTLVARFQNSPNRAFRFQLGNGANAGKLKFDWSTDGTNLQSGVTSSAAVGFAGTDTGWVRVVLDVDNGASGHDIKFYTSSDGVTWTQLGTTTTRAGATSLYNPGANAPFEIGARGGASEPFAATWHEVEVRNGIGGPLVAPRHPDAWYEASVGDAVWAGAPVLTLVNGSAAGSGQTYITDTTRAPKLLSAGYEPRMIFLSCSHNDAGFRARKYWSTWDTWLTNLRARFPLAPVVVIGQNPRLSPATRLTEHAIRRTEAALWAAANGLGFVDVYREFTDAPDGFAGLMESDGIHPNAAGSRVWRDAVLAHLYERA